MRPRLLIAGALMALMSGSLPLASAQVGDPSETFARAKVIDILEERREEEAGMERTVQTVLLRLITGPETGKEFTTENGVLRGREDMRMRKGETIVVRKLTKVDGSVEYLTAEKYRLPSVLWLGGFFLILTFLFGGWTGLRSMLGLLVSILVLTLYVVPQIAGGSNPMSVSLIGAFFIACTSLYLAHGFHRRTSVALLATLLTLAIATALAIAFVHLAKLFGMGSDESLYLQTGMLESVNLRGLLLGGIIIGCLGVLDDITTAQVAAIGEIKKANPLLSFSDLWRAGNAIGKEHIASLINTLALAYAGASLPLLLLFTVHEDYPLWVTLNSEFLSEEIIRTLVGSATLLFAVPISTWCAAHFLGKRPNNSPLASAPVHSHSHHVRLP